MRQLDLLPAGGMVLLATTFLVAAQLLPFGETTLLVRLADRAPGAALVAAAASDAALVATPAPGFAVLHGDAAHIRKTLGFSVSWLGIAPCSIDQQAVP